MTREHNWADNYTFKAARIHRPASIDEVRRLVAGSARVRALGTRHSFNGLADSAGDLIDLSGIDPDFAIDRERQTVTVGAATRYGPLASHLHAQGFALHNMGSLPHISVAGATATGTHGSGDRNGTLSTAVVGLELVTGDGDIVRVRRGDAGFDGMVVGLGAFGVVTRVTLEIQPSFDMRQDGFVDLPWTAVLDNLDEVTSAAYSVSLLTMWSQATVGRLWLKTRLTEDGPLEVTAAHLGATAAPHVVSTGPDDPADRLNPFGVAGPWSERLPHFRLDREPGPDEQIQSEYMVPRSQAMVALARLRAIGGRIDPHLHVTEIRTMAADALWLSPSYGEDSVAIHFTWKKEPDAVDAITAEIEDMLLPLGARPHWGKLMHARADRIAQLYPRLPDFRALADSYDPGGKFRNEFLAEHVFGSSAGQDQASTSLHDDRTAAAR
ncbi:MAG TPA: FAD-binding protein [Acetobacteraceae bacterium]